MKNSPMLRAIALLGFLLAANASNLRTGPPPPATYRIAEIVVDSVTGQPLEGAEVSIAPVTDLNEQQTFLTSSDGRFLFVDLPRAKYRLMAGRGGYANQGLHQHEGYMTAIATGPGLDSEHIRFPLAPSSVITGVVTDEWGDPVRAAKVLLFQQSMFDGSRTLRNVSQSTADDQGRYRFAHLLAGTYAVAVYARPWYTRSQIQVTSDVTQYEVSTAETSVLDDSAQPSPSAGLNPLFDVVYPVTFFPSATSLAEASRLALASGVTETADFQLHAVPSVHLRVRVPVQPPTRVTVASETVDSEGNAQETGGDTSEIESSADVALSLKIGEGYTDELEPTRREIAPGIIELSGIPPGEINLVAGSILGPISILGSISRLQEVSYVSRTKTLNVSGDTDVDLSAQGDSASVSGVVLASQFHPAPTNAGQASSGQAPPDQGTPDQNIPTQAPEDAPSNVTLTFHSLKTGESYDATVSSGEILLRRLNTPSGCLRGGIPGAKWSPGQFSRSHGRHRFRPQHRNPCRPARQLGGPRVGSQMHTFWFCPEERKTGSRRNGSFGSQ